MSIADVRAAFNAIAMPNFGATIALMDYVRIDDVKYTVLTFRGSSASGPTFEVKSDMLPPGVDVMEGAKATARMLIETRRAIVTANLPVVPSAEGPTLNIVRD